MHELIKTIEMFKKMNDLSKMKQNIFLLAQRDLEKSKEQHLESATNQDLAIIFHLIETIDRVEIQCPLPIDA